MAGSESDKDSTKARNLLAGTITGLCVGGLLALGSVIILSKNTGAVTPNTQLVWAGIVPLLGSWVGTVLAYYFSKENFESATRSVASLAQAVAPDQRLQSIPVRSKMIPRNQMFVKTLPADKIVLADAIKELEASKKGQRIPIVDASDRGQYVVHRSVIDKFLADSSRAASATAAPQPLTLQALLDSDAATKKLVTKSIATVSENATLAEAKAQMDHTPDCEDVFVTKGGTPTEPLSGWVTDIIIAESARV